MTHCYTRCNREQCASTLSKKRKCAVELTCFCNQRKRTSKRKKQALFLLVQQQTEKKQHFVMNKTNKTKQTTSISMSWRDCCNALHFAVCESDCCIHLVILLLLHRKNHESELLFRCFCCF